MGRDRSHVPVFTTLDEPLNDDTPRRMVPLQACRTSGFVDGCKKLVSSIETFFKALGYRVVEPAILFNTKECLSQEPHEDGPVISNEFPTLSVLINPLVSAQGIWIARKSHLEGNCFLERVSICSGQAVVLRHDVCHAGIAIPPETRLVRIHLNLVHSTDSRENPTFSEYVLATLRTAGGHLVGLGSSGDFNHVLHLVDRSAEEQAQLPEVEERHDGQETGQRKRSIATSALEDIILSSRANANALQEEVMRLSSQANITDARVVEARALLLELEAESGRRRALVDAEMLRLATALKQVEGLEAALELVLHQ